MARDLLRDVFENTRGYDPEESFEAFETVAEDNAIRDSSGEFVDEESEGINTINRFKKVRERNQERSARARKLDNSFRAEITTDVETWSENPDEYDFPGVDTPDDMF